MREPSDDPANVSDESVVGRDANASQVGEWVGQASASADLGLRADPLLSLLRLGPDAVIDQLCEGRPRNFMEECQQHVSDNAYFIEEGRVAARVIATLASYACDAAPTEYGAPSMEERLTTIVEEATAAVLEEGALHGDVGADPDPMIQRIELVLGTDERHARGILDTLNGFEFSDRHVLFHCIVGGLTPEGYAAKFNDDARVVDVMLRNASKMALEGPA
jgi:hypothetical protein